MADNPKTYEDSDGDLWFELTPDRLTHGWRGVEGAKSALADARRRLALNQATGLVGRSVADVSAAFGPLRLFTDSTLED